MRQTSVDIYNKIKAEGLLSKCRQMVYECLFKSGPLTQAEAHSLIGGDKVVQMRSISPRFSELEALGVIAAGKTRKCRITGNNAIEWDATTKLPVKPAPRESCREELARVKEELDRALKTIEKLNGNKQMWLV